MISTCSCCGKICEMSEIPVIDPLTCEVFFVVYCSSCGQGRTKPIPCDFSPYYPFAYYGGRHGLTAMFCLRRRLRWIEGRNCGETGDRRLLDIGCGDGSFLRAAEARGWKVAGIERFPDDARKKGIEVYTDVSEITQYFCFSEKRGEQSLFFAPTPIFDCITLWHSLEHIDDLHVLLKAVTTLLKPEGRVFVAVPDFGGWQSRCFGRHWLHLDVPRHLWHFTQCGLHEVFNTCHLEVQRVFHQEFEYDLLGWSQSALNVIFKKQNVFFHWLTKKSTGVSKSMLILHVALGLGFSVLSLPLVWLGTLFKRGGTLVIIGRRTEQGVRQGR